MEGCREFMKTKVTDYYIIEHIARGKFGEVFKVSNN